MKRMKLLGIACLWMMVCSTTIYSRTRPLEFEIQYDSHTKQTYQIKKQMQEIYDDLVSGLHADSQSVMVMHNIKKFAFAKNIKASWNGKLVLKEGNGKGSVITGELVTKGYCVEKVQPRSFLQELFHWK